MGGERLDGVADVAGRSVDKKSVLHGIAPGDQRSARCGERPAGRKRLGLNEL